MRKCYFFCLLIAFFSGIFAGNDDVPTLKVVADVENCEQKKNDDVGAIISNVKLKYLNLEKDNSKVKIDENLRQYIIRDSILTLLQDKKWLGTNLDKRTKKANVELVNALLECYNNNTSKIYKVGPSFNSRMVTPQEFANIRLKQAKVKRKRSIVNGVPANKRKRRLPGEYCSE